MKIFIGNSGCCNLNYQHRYINYKLCENHEIVEDPSLADAIVLVGNCSCTDFHITNSLSYVKDIVSIKKDSAKVYITGCITREFDDKGYLPEISYILQKFADYIIPQNKPGELLKLISEEEFSNLDCDDFGFVEQLSPDHASIYVSNGCLNNCSFCKVNFQKYPLKSCNLEELKETIDICDEKKISHIFLKGTNICQYGLDLKHEYLLPEVIEYIESKENIKDVELVGFAFSDAIKNNFQESIKTSTKVNKLSGALESGSDRLLKLIRKGFSSGEIIDFVNEIRQFYDKKLLLNVIAGFPTETIEDVMVTLDVLKSLDPYEVDICRYTNSQNVDSAKYEQLSPATIQEHARIYSKTLKRRSVKTNIVGAGYKYN